MTALQTKLKFTQVTPRTWSTLGSTGNIYTLNLLAGALSCDCLAGKHLRTCYHIDQLAKTFKTELNASLIAPQDPLEITEDFDDRLVLSTRRRFPP
ncbi:hypothetical protein V2H45_05695 [Tumidithrix elongata RA019]|uniref:SWIM-type domain-containing protein n=1 Tax=Tumidithrix elongata BACA0141 TaxID=2716417 RepID=A0AAW9PX99_9CYAN|nr:hypothetical protein [Tumidithrix elongata RA019]